jgi:hypothetical protein
MDTADRFMLVGLAIVFGLIAVGLVVAYVVG